MTLDSLNYEWARFSSSPVAEFGSPLEVCKGAARPLACALSRTLRILHDRDENWTTQQGEALDYTAGERASRVALVAVAVGLALVALVRAS